MRRLARAAAVLLVLSGVAAADDAAPEPNDRLISWHFRHSHLYLDVGWPEGLTYELGRSQDLPDEPVLRRLEDVVLSGQVRFRLDLDAAGFITPPSLGDFENGVVVRRARLHVNGQLLLGVTTDYDFEVSVQGQQFFLNEFYLSWNPNRLGVATITLGHTTPPMGLENLQSSRSLVFMEMGSPSTALAPSYRTGLMLNGEQAPWHLAWAAGFFTLGQQQATGDASKALAQGIGRLSGWVGSLADVDFVHLGASASELFSGQSDIEYQSRPESFKAPFVVDTNPISSSSATQYGVEAAWSHGPRLIQAELLQSFVSDTERSDGDFWGAYLLASWFLTGEHRPYDPSVGLFDRARPQTNFHFHEPGWGAFEVAARISYLDLTSGEIRGGDMLNGTAGLNWYLNPELRLMFNYIVTRVTKGNPHGVGNIFQARIEIGL